MLNKGEFPSCQDCGTPLVITIMTIVDGPCWKCDSNMKVAIIRGGMNRGSTTVGPDQFTSDELKLAGEKGVLIEQHYSKTAGEKYLANTCPTCKTFAGNFYLFTQYFTPAENCDYPSKRYEVGFHCEECY